MEQWHYGGSGRRERAATRTVGPQVDGQRQLGLVVEGDLQHGSWGWEVRAGQAGIGWRTGGWRATCQGASTHLVGRSGSMLSNVPKASTSSVSRSEPHRSCRTQNKKVSSSGCTAVSAAMRHQ